MFDKILVATDLSKASDRVLSCTRGLIPLGAKTVRDVGSWRRCFSAVWLIR
jgi:nucleotide-binding universal stress UspA family protein